MIRIELTNNPASKAGNLTQWIATRYEFLTTYLISLTTMKDQIKLINSTYKSKDAKEVISSLINDKINFLNMKIFSQKIRFGEESQHLTKRTEELKSDLQKLISQINDLQEDDLIEISCDVKIKIKSAAQK